MTDSRTGPPDVLDRLCLRPADALEILARLPKSCGGETCRDPECAYRAELASRIGAAADLYRALVDSYEAKVQDLARETLASSALRARLARVEEAARAASKDVKIILDRHHRGGFANQDRFLELISDALDAALSGKETTE